jgi:hypothetical protein
LIDATLALEGGRFGGRLAFSGLVVML